MKKDTENRSDSSVVINTLVLRALKYAGAILGGIIFIIVLIIYFFPDPFVNSFLKNRIENALAQNYPHYTIKLGRLHYSAWNNRLSSDTLSLKSSDSSLSFTAHSISIGGISWMKLFLQGGVSGGAITNLTADAGKISYISNTNRDMIYIERLHISLPDSEFTADSIKYNPLIGDESLFSKSRFRQTRLRLHIPRITLEGFDFYSAINKNHYKARILRVNNLFSDILVNMDKPYDANSIKPLMPNEAIRLMKDTFEIDTVKIINGRLKYSERYVMGAVPGIINFDKVNITASGLANNSGVPDTANIKADGIFMNAGIMRLNMSIPLTQEKFSMHYSGSLGPMDATKLNAFIVPAEHHRIKSGNIQSARYNIVVSSGQATGSLKVEYRDLSIAILNKDTGSEKGIFDKIASFFGKIFVIRGNNIPNEKGEMKMGEIKYSRKTTDYFTQYLWFSLRGGIADVAGFPRE